MSEVIRYDYYGDKDWTEHLIGKSVVSADKESGTLTLSDGTIMAFDKSNSDCCSWIELMDMSAVGNIITAATIEDDSTGVNEYKAWVHVVTRSGFETNIVEADGNASNGYYLDGFALGVTVTLPDAPTEEELAAALRSLGVKDV